MISALVHDPILLALWVLWLAFLIGSLVTAAVRPDRRVSVAGKIGSSVLLALAAWVGCFSGRPTVAAGVPVALAMTLGLFGDLALARLLRLSQPELVGVAGFGLGHACYCVAILAYASRAGLTALLPMIVGLVIWWVVGVGCWYLAVWRGNEPTPLHWATLIYALLLSTTAGLASGIGLQWSSLLPIAAGGALFVSSDLLIAADMSGEIRLPARDILVWATYGPAQMLIVYGLVLAVV